MSMNTQGRPTGVGTASTGASGSALLPDEPLLFEIGDTEHSGVDLPDVEITNGRLGGFERKTKLDLAGLTEPEAMRHYVRLSRLNHSIDSGMYPLGSCTMKHNPRLNEKTARLPGFSDIHPLQPVSTVQGALELMNELSHWLMTLTNTAAVALSPKAGAHGELLGMMAIKAAQDAKGESHRNVVLVPESAHGTNPATAAFLGYTVKPVPAKADGTVDVEAVKTAIAPDVAAIMLTNPNTCGLFEPQVIEIAKAIHDAGAYFYCDGANFNAIMGVVRPGDLGIDAMHINLHKTFSTPHGGGGPGAGPVVLSEALAPFAPVPFVRKGAQGLELVEHVENQALGRVTAFHGQMGMYVRALTYMLSHGADGLAQAAEDAVLNANYVKARLQHLFSVPFPDYPTMHEALFNDSFLKDTGVTTLDFAKALIDEGFHPMTMYFPLVVHGAMLIEPTESESKQTLDRFCDVMAELATEAKSGNAARFTGAPMKAPRRRLDETRAARQPILKWERAAEMPKAAE
ncbi:aminomethyl-transferring glycine dehydrogenase subunit GcvPB [Devosia sp. MC521]|uniref:aminomethyl-transferring glycine dehydrogenase subunit GcvPB n=1 Tax=Devosia sp. MC521 TaxID=2759954 RepID=UPI0015F9E083|nr:aminomethyl-transferring glycine dehydrogenase subunit GcvPB [Devosia sp. MC521]MBJ6988267.1 aminomethyl-transferring glycine dehydrogenase subunit GcvPB [Devosia sp. MC521]QMW63221.1 aminomethyl-transferring glycine dehydrogenase subunit GcvPB [Devosia sp. MC521]